VDGNGLVPDAGSAIRRTHPCLDGPGRPSLPTVGAVLGRHGPGGAPTTCAEPASYGILSRGQQDLRGRPGGRHHRRRLERLLGHAVRAAPSGRAGLSGRPGRGRGAGAGSRSRPADPARGQAAARVCVACHSFEKGGADKIGPGLWDIVNREIGKHGGYAYSSVLAGMGGVWDYAALDAFIAAPRAYAPGTKMSFAGIGDAKRRADIIAYLRSLADEPAPLPQAAEAPATAGGS
jgi:cytochrome c2